MIYYGQPLSPAAQRAKQEAAARRRWYQTKRQLERQKMELGPRREGRWIVIPSDWYCEEAKEFWKSLGAQFHEGDPESHVWILDAEEATWKGKRYTVRAWLRSIRKKFYEFYDLGGRRDGEDDED